MPTPDIPSDILLAEHERLSALFLYNSDLGEKRTAAYLTLVSLGVGGLLGLSQLQADQDTILQVSLGIMSGIFLLGFITFFRLIERRVRNTEYLRAINRIHAYYVHNDPSLEPYFFWPPSDDAPHFMGKVSDFTGLRDIVAILNGVFFGIAVALIGHMLEPEPRVILPWAIVLGVALGIAVLAIQVAIETLTLRKAERLAQGNVRFPSAIMPTTDQAWSDVNKKGPRD